MVDGRVSWQETEDWLMGDGRGVMAGDSFQVAHDDTLVAENSTSLEHQREGDPVINLDVMGEVANEVNSLKGALEDQMRDITSQVAMVQKELQKLQNDTFSQMESLEKSLPAQVQQLERESTPRRKHSSLTDPQSVLQREKKPVQRRISWSPDVVDNAKRPGDVSLADMSKKRLRMMRRARAQQADSNTVLQTTLYCILVVILSKVIPHLVEFMQDLNDEHNDDHSWTTSSSFDE